VLMLKDGTKLKVGRVFRDRLGLSIMKGG